MDILIQRSLDKRLASKQPPVLAYKATSEMKKIMADITLCNLEELLSWTYPYGSTRRESGKLKKAQQQEVLKLARGFPAIGKNPTTPVRENKHMIRFLIEDVTIIRWWEDHGKGRFDGDQDLVQFLLFDLDEEPPDYDELIDLIFEFDEVITWW